MTKLVTKIEIDINTAEGKPLPWHVEVYQLEDTRDKDNLYVHVINEETGEIVFECLLSEWQRIGKAVEITSKAELDVQDLK